MKMAPNGKHVVFDTSESDLNNNDIKSDPLSNGSIGNGKVKSEDKHGVHTSLAQTNYVPIPYKMKINWTKSTFVILFHVLGIAGVFHFHLVKMSTLFFTLVLGQLSSIGVQIAAHRYWAHRSFNASPGLRLFLAACYTMAFQSSIHEWVRDHRGHHKWSDTDADPYNANRGFFFSHMGWIGVNKHPEVIRKGKTLDLSDIESDPIVMFQKRYYLPLVLFFWGFLPAAIPVYFWGENVWYSILVCVFMRHLASLHVTWLVNSWAHMWGYRPYDHRIAPVEASAIRHLLMGEAFHNYHHAYPWDYSASELGPMDVFNPATAYIDFFQRMGWAWNLKKPSLSLVKAKSEAHGDKSISYRDGRSIFKEWALGMLSCFGPWFALRYVLIALCGN